MKTIKDIKPFVPSNEYATSKAFYECMGFKVSWDAGEVCEIDTNFGYRFLLLPGNHNNYGESLMLQLMVDSAQDWYEHFVSVRLSEKFPGTKIAALPSSFHVFTPHEWIVETRILPANSFRSTCANCIIPAFVAAYTDSPTILFLADIDDIKTICGSSLSNSIGISFFVNSN